MNEHQAMVRRILDTAAGMFPSYIGGPGFWRYVKDEAGIEGFQIEETNIEAPPAPTKVYFHTNGETLLAEWISPR